MSLAVARTPEPRPGPGSGGSRGLVAALLLTIALAIVGVMVAVPGLATSGLPGLPGASTPPPAAAVVERAVVVASSSCVHDDARDIVMLQPTTGAGRLIRLDACGSSVGESLTVRVTDGQPVAELVGTGQIHPRSGTGALPGRPGAERLALLLTAIAALGTAALVVTVARQRSRHRPAGRGSGR